jgi:hypothetical protein
MRRQRSLHRDIETDPETAVTAVLALWQALGHREKVGNAQRKGRQ